MNLFVFTHGSAKSLFQTRCKVGNYLNKILMIDSTIRISDRDNFTFASTFFILEYDIGALVVIQYTKSISNIIVYVNLYQPQVDKQT